MLRNIVALSAITLLLACNGGTTGPSPAPGTPGPGTLAPGTSDAGGEPVTVTVQNIAFETDSVTIEPGTEVSWVNEDAVGHTITHGQQGVPAEGSVIDEPHPVGETVSFTFEQPGQYPITCTIHPQMNMTVEVEE